MPEPVLTLTNVSLDYRTRESFFRHRYRRALDDLSFDVLRGETLGVIGGNGSGKSTLLRVLAGIYRPNGGEIARRCDRIMLLSLALGFDPELSARENALLSGVLLGGARRAVSEKLDEILAFAELEERANDPLKTYSSGMRARLGFSVALTMKADLLLIDEVLGVGDLQFQQKAKAAMLDRINSEQTVVFVSHSIGMVEQLCSRVIWLDQGRIVLQGDTQSVLAAYRKHQQDKLGQASATSAVAAVAG
ncbi:MAG: ABC transporter ATP-binding protein [Chromatiaceae bacterium]|nr:ABC transporter ATP-binding protein [Chromatiaceae bacterium]MCF7993336.1 ABC transporter ATP-binding protein [Chromatiaceae bacterium]MCF8014850.1 ABC transporter ATP-binding protein [Chromatiaceae bacterium]